MTENIITPNFTNGVTIVVMAIVFFTFLYAVTQGVHWAMGQQGSGS